jgi:ribosomal protein S18 acetylase RimI-like enzyme
MIRLIEELSMNALPSLQTMLYDGWVLRFANGYTRRANSISPLYSSRLPINDKIAACENDYEQRGIKVNFKMTSETQPEDLDRLLEARGYLVNGYTSVQTVNLQRVQIPDETGVSMESRLTNEWLYGYYRMSAIKCENQPVMAQILRLIIPSTCFASIVHAGQVVACGMSVYQEGWSGLFDVVTDPALRRQGYGEKIVNALLSWGKSQGAHFGYLQVMENNTPALNLYAKLGFRDVYRYWYRGKP